MATNDSLESQASQRINPFLRGLSILTGGIAGEFTGTNEQIRRQNAINQALLQDEFAKRDEERAMRRQLMVNALKEGVELDPNANLDQMIKQIRMEGVRKSLLQGAGRISAYNEATGQTPQGLALLADRNNPYFQTAQIAAKADLNEKEAQAALEEKRQTPALRAQLEGLAPGTYIPPEATAGQLRGMIQATQYKLPMQLRQESDVEAVTDMYASNPDLKAFKGYTPETIGKVAPVLAKTMMALARKELEQTAESKNMELAISAIDEFNAEAGKDTPDQAKLKTLFYKLPADAKKDARNRMIAGYTQAPTPKERESLVKYREMLGGAQNLATSLSSLAGSENLAKVSRDNFNGFQSWLRGIQNKYGAEDSRLRTINDIVQQFEAVVAGKRKDLFGASLTGNELESARQQFADPKSANFLPRMVQFLDGVFSRDVVNEDYKQFGIQVPAELEKTVQDARQRWLTTREQLNFGSLGGTRKTSQSRVDSLRNEAAQLRQALGMTNAPSLKR
jgi:hypothetical protein